MPSRISAATSWRVHFGAGAEQLGPGLVAVLDLEQREERCVSGHELERRLGALAQSHERIGIGIHSVGLRGRSRNRMLVTSSANRASLFSKYQ